MMRQTLVLFDVDGTLLISGGATSRCIHRASREVLGDAYQEGVITAGRLDPEIFVELARQCGVEDAAVHLERYKGVYLGELESELQRVRAEVKVLPGVREVLAELAERSDVVLGLLTGNFRRAVELKLAAAGLDASQFRIGAFAEDGRERQDLVRAAIEQYERLVGGAAERERVIVIGDTPRDVECAHAHGCVSFAVATGWYKPAQLAAVGADYVVEDLGRSELLIALLDRLRDGKEKVD